MYSQRPISVNFSALSKCTATTVFSRSVAGIGSFTVILSLIHISYALLNLISFLTAGEDECRAWTIRRGTKAPQAAGKIHTDFEEGFIRAETIAYDKLMEVGGSLAAAKEKGFLRSEGKEYVMKDGDVVNFLFNV